ncbi:heparin-sulfate lyase HepC [Niabella aurantiaca]|uniref:heparin-sulfate lyase HepC n=1 Tax=Niabella aurantiaca TaxID=379900 RepID=UPI000366D455|nr:heparin-sulfate lyase HepC [Niabella aurantiaca]
MPFKKTTGTKRGMIMALLLLLMGSTHAQGPLNKESFNIVNLGYPGLERTKMAFDAGRYRDAAAELLKYYRQKNKGGNTAGSDKVSKQTKESADNALLHHFKPHKGYGYFDYGKDINWQYWPVKDNEVRWQLHRVKWWADMAQVYQATGDEKYAREWMAQFSDWAKKNPLGLSKDNDRFAWRALEISERLNNLRAAFTAFVRSPNFTPAFLLEFLNNYQHQTNYLSHHYATEGNHRLFEAQRVLTAGTSFPEYTTAETWRNSGVAVLNDEIKKQVYADGMQWELSINYHVAMINTFINALRSAQEAGMDHVFPASYKQTVEKMILATISISFPDYTYPMYGDAKMQDKRGMLKSYKSWAKVFPDNVVIQYFATDGKKGKQPSFLSRGLTDAGFYTFRNGWNNDATVMVLKASPPGKFHAQPDNGTFELWIKGRNFAPDAGSFVYSGDAAIMQMREWYRQTRIHNTLTLDNKNMVITKAHLDKWKTAARPPSDSLKGEKENGMDLLTYTNPSYKGLDHQRSVLFIDQKYFLIIDKAIGKATGVLDAHFVLKEDSNPVYDQALNRVYTTYSDGNNLLIQNLNKDKIRLKEEEGKVSYSYRQELPRPLFAFEKPKADAQTQTFITILYPYSGSKAPAISLKENAGNDLVNGKIDITLTVDGVNKKITTTL